MGIVGGFDASINQKIFDKSLDLILVVDGDGLIIRVSPSAAVILGYEPAELEGRIARDFVFPDDLEMIRSVMRKMKRGDAEIRNVKCRYIRRNGDTAILTWSGLWSQEEGQFFFIGRDITALIAIDEITAELRRIERQLSAGTRTALFIRAGDVRVIEVFLTGCSLWAAYALAHPPSNFTTYPGAFFLAASLVNDEWMWAAFAAIAAMMKLVGLLVGWFSFRNPVSVAMRYIGLGMSAVFWLTMSVSTIYGNPDTLFGGGGFLQGMLALLTLISLVSI